MAEVIQTPEFRKWLARLKDDRAAARIAVRLDRLALGHPGDVKSFDGISEFRINYGPGYRVYYMQRGQLLIVLLCGGDKDSQSKDIKRAKALASEWKDTI